MIVTTDYAIRPYCSDCGNTVQLRVTETESRIRIEKTTVEIQALGAPFCRQCTRDKDSFNNILELLREEGRQEVRERMGEVFDAAVSWHDWADQYGVKHHDTVMASGYLYDRITRYKKKAGG